MRNVEELFEAFNELNVLIIGDVMIDRYINGKVSRISPEAPVPIVQHESTENRLGGAANVALNIQAMGATPLLCSVVGSDENANLFFQLLEKHQLAGQGILQSKDRKTTIKTRVLASNQQLLRIDTEDIHDLSMSMEKKLIHHVTTILEESQIDIILFQDYNKGVLSATVISAIINEAMNRNIKTAVDPKKKNFFAYKNCDLFKPNLKEIKEALDFPVSSNLQDLQKASSYLQKQLKNKQTIITLSEKGLYIDDSINASILPTQKRNITDVCGAGDSVISIAALALAMELKAETVALLANLAGGQVCEKVGVVPIDKIQLQQEYIQYLKMLKTAIKSEK